MVGRSDFEELRKWRTATSGPLTVLAIGSLPLLLLHTVADRLSTADKVFLFIVDLTVFVAFATDYSVELFLSRNRLSYVKTQWLNLLIVLAQLAALLPALGALGALRAIRGLRVVTTFARVAGIAIASSRRQGLETLRARGARMAFAIAGFTWISSAVAFMLVEDVGTDKTVDSFFDALWWSATTITTVGYGDIYPVTATGRIIAVFTMIVGISALAVVTARVAAFFLGTNPTQKS